jgi:hypothetical protein
LECFAPYSVQKRITGSWKIFCRKEQGPADAPEGGIFFASFNAETHHRILDEFFLREL